jgi:hypothetical protein
VKQQLAAVGAPRRLPTSIGGKQEVAPGSQVNFQIFTKMPLNLNAKLLSKFQKKLKISKNKSCSNFQTLQLSQ